MTFGQFIRQKRIENNLKQIIVANRLGWSQQMLSALENDQRQWTITRIVQIAPLFNMQAWELVKNWSEILPEST